MKYLCTIKHRGTTTKKQLPVPHEFTETIVCKVDWEATNKANNDTK